MRKLKVTILFPLLLMGLLLSGSLSNDSIKNVKKLAPKYELKYKLKKGAKFTVTNSRSDHYIREVMGNEMVTNTDDMSEYGFEVMEENTDNIKLMLEFKNRIQKTDDPQAAGGVDFSSLAGKKVGLSMSSTGKVSGFEGFENLPVIEIAYQQTTINKDSYINEIKQLLPMLPENPVGIGDNWKSVYEYDEPVPEGTVKVTLNYIYTVLEETVKDGIGCLKINGAFTIVVKGEGVMEGMTFTFNMEGKGNDTVYFNHKKGMLLSIEGESIAKGEADLAEAGLTIPMDHTYKNRLNVIF